MKYEEFNNYCSSLPCTTHVIQWGNSHVWKVGGKVFAIGGWEKRETPTFTFKASDSDFYFLSDEPGFRPASYFATRGMKWIQYHNVPKSEAHKLKHFLKKSHHLVSLGLTKKNKKNLD